MTTKVTIVSVPVADRRRARDFYVEGLGLETVGELEDDGMPEPLRFRLGDDVLLMLIPRQGFAWVLGEQPAARPGQSECMLNLDLGSDEEVDAAVARAEAAGAEVKLSPEQKQWGYTGSFTDPDGHLWLVTNAVAW